MLRVLAVVAGIAAIVGVAYEKLAERTDSERYSFPGRLVSVGSHRLHLYCIGEGAPTVVMEAGLGEQSLTWSLVQPTVAANSRACSYDRAGYGWSEVGPQPRSPDRGAQELHDLLSAAGESGPYVLVAHSIGAHVARLFVSRYPAEVVGVVLIEPTDEEAALQVGTPALPIAQYRLFSLVARFGVVRLFGASLVTSMLDSDPPDAVVRNAPAIYSSRALGTAADELSASVNGARSTAAARHALRDVRLAVILGELPGATEYSKKLAMLSRRGTHRIVPRSGHYVQYERPDVVADEIRRVIEQARSE